MMLTKTANELVGKSAVVVSGDYEGISGTVDQVLLRGDRAVVRLIPATPVGAIFVDADHLAGPGESIKRLQFDLPNNKIKELDELLRISGLASRKDLFNNALTLFQWALRERQAGRSIASVDKSTQSYKQLEMESLTVHERERQ